MCKELLDDYRNRRIFLFSTIHKAKLPYDSIKKVLWYIATVSKSKSYTLLTRYSFRYQRNTLLLESSRYFVRFAFMDVVILVIKAIYKYCTVTSSKNANFLTVILLLGIKMKSL